MGVVDHIASKLAFFPPSPATYALERHADNGDLYISPKMPGLRKVPDAQVLQLQTKRGSLIVAALISHHLKERPTILFSHGNAVDLALMLPFYREMSRELHISILSYDYSGYGCSSGALSVANTLADIDAAYEWLLANGRQPSDVILYGQSVGSGPTCYLGAKAPALAGVVLHSALASDKWARALGMRVVNPGWGWWPSWLDVYHNLRLLPKIQAPVLVMHGTKDEVVDISAGRALHAAARNPAEPLWIEGCDHQSVELSVAYLPRMRRFIQSCMRKFSKTKSGVKIQELADGNGLQAAPGDSVEFDYVLRRNNGYFIVSSVEGMSFQPRDVPTGPVTARLGAGQLIPGLEEVLAGMRPGSKRRALVPPAAGYADATDAAPQPPTFATQRQLRNHQNEPLLFEIQVLRVRRPAQAT